MSKTTGAPSAGSGPPAVPTLRRLQLELEANAAEQARQAKLWEGLNQRIAALIREDTDDKESVSTGIA